MGARSTCLVVTKNKSWSSPTVNSEQGWCPTWKGCHMNWQWQCICPWGPYHPWDRDVGKDGPAEAAKPDSGLSAPTECMALAEVCVIAGPPRSQCCAGLKCKNDRPGLRAGGMGHCVKPEDDTDEGVAKSQEGGNSWCCKKHLSC